MKKILVFALPVLLVATFIIYGPVHAFSAHYGPSELLYYDSEKAYNGYSLFTPLSSPLGYTWLIDMEGNVVHRWGLPVGTTINQHAKLIDDDQEIPLIDGKQGVLLRALRPVSNQDPANGTTLQLVSWANEVLWEVDTNEFERSGHHDFRRIWNNKLGEYTYIIIASKLLTRAEALALGVDPRKFRDESSDPDGIIEVDQQGRLIWEWHFVDHTVQDRDNTLPNYGVITEHPEKMDINFGNGPLRDWHHFNGLDYNEELDQIVVNGRTFSEFYVIDHGATFVSEAADFTADFEAAVSANVAEAAGPKGDLLFRWGNPVVYGGGDIWTGEGVTFTPGEQQMYYSHNPQWVDAPNPGAGNLLIFDNGSHRGWESAVYSKIIEIDPYDESGDYIPEVVAGFSVPQGVRGVQVPISNQVVWSYNSKNPTSFYSSYISGCQRLPNGNTVVCSGANGHFFEVTADKEVVWEYINPDGALGVLSLIPDSNGRENNETFRLHRYASDHPVLTGKDLLSMGTLTGLDPITRTMPPAPPAPTGWGTSGLENPGAGGGGATDGGGATGGGGGY